MTPLYYNHKRISAALDPHHATHATAPCAARRQESGRCQHGSANGPSGAAGIHGCVKSYGALALRSYHSACASAVLTYLLDADVRAVGVCDPVVKSVGAGGEAAWKMCGRARANRLRQALLRANVFLLHCCLKRFCTSECRLWQQKIFLMSCCHGPHRLLCQRN